MHGTARHQAQRHPVAAFLVILFLSPYILAFVLLYAVVYLTLATFEMLGRR